MFAWRNHDSIHIYRKVENLVNFKIIYVTNFEKILDIK